MPLKVLNIVICLGHCLQVIVLVLVKMILQIILKLIVYDSSLLDA